MRKDASAQVLPAADQVVNEAESVAKSEHKTILLVFGASWCEPCHLLDKFLDDPAARGILEKSFVIVHLDAGEKKIDKAHANNPGAIEEMVKAGGGSAGYPYMVLLDAEGAWIADSIQPREDGPGENIGYPSTREDIDWFTRMVKKSAPGMTAEDAKTIRGWLEQRATR